MIHSSKLARRIARLRAPALAGVLIVFGACDNANPLDPDTSAPTDPAETGIEAAPIETPEFATSFAGGIPMGLMAQPTSWFGSRYNGALRNIGPEGLRSELAAIKARGGRVVLTFSGNERNYKDANGHFSLTKWKARVDRYKNINFSSYISDGTIIGHWLVDEPQDPTNWNGTRISQSTLEAMAKYSKQRWPGMVTIVRTWPDYLDDWSGHYYYLDAAWAQYVAKRFPNLSAFVSSNVSKAKAKGLGLVVGLMLTKGSPTGGRMSASQIKTYGAALLNNSYPCAFISYQYGDYVQSYLNSSSVKDAMSYLRRKAQNHGSKSCRG